MKLTIEVDAMHHEIDTTVPEILGAWVVEIFDRYEITPATMVRVQAYPSVLRNNITGQWDKLDWVADSRIISQLREARSPRELVQRLSDWLDEYEHLTETKHSMITAQLDTNWGKLGLNG